MFTRIAHANIVAMLGVWVCLSLSAGSAQADVYNWIGPSGGNWDSAANWTGGSGLFPGPADTAQIDPGLNCAINVDGAQSVGGLDFTNAGGLATGGMVQLNSGALTIGSPLSVGSGQTFSGSASIIAPVNLLGGTLAGNLSITGNVTSTGGIIAPGGSGWAGTVSVTGNVILDHNTVLNYDLGTPGPVGGGYNDFLNISGNLSLDGTLNAKDLFESFEPWVYTLMAYTGTLTGSGLNIGTMPYPVFAYYVDTGMANKVNLDTVTCWPRGDTNWDGVYNSLDIDGIYHHFGAPASSRWKVVYDNLPVGQEDVTYELQNFFNTSYGDANLDRKTDFLDFQVLLDHWEASGPGIGWADGDFDGSGTVDFRDFQMLLDYWNPAGWNFAPEQTPEPATLSLLALGILPLLKRRK